MKKNYLKSAKVLLVMGSAMFFAACATISKYDQYAYQQTTSLKVDALNVMNLATGKYDSNASAVLNVNTSIDKMVEYEKNRPKNEVSEKMWVILQDSTQNLYGGFIKRWKTEGTLDPVFIKESQQMVGQAFDQISELESGKIKSQQVTN
jgi:PBP1b-binding outer membrane lipoprotein LpoB